MNRSSHPSNVAGVTLPMKVRVEAKTRGRKSEGLLDELQLGAAHVRRREENAGWIRLCHIEKRGYPLDANDHKV